MQEVRILTNPATKRFTDDPKIKSGWTTSRPAILLPELRKLVPAYGNVPAYGYGYGNTFSKNSTILCSWVPRWMTRPCGSTIT